MQLYMDLTLKLDTPATQMPFGGILVFSKDKLLTKTMAIMS